MERISGRTLGVHLTEHVYEPLGTIDSTFHPTAEQRSRLMPLRMRGADGSLHPTESCRASCVRSSPSSPTTCRRLPCRRGGASACTPSVHPGRCDAAGRMSRHAAAVSADEMDQTRRSGVRDAARRAWRRHCWAPQRAPGRPRSRACRRRCCVIRMARPLPARESAARPPLRAPPARRRRLRSHQRPP